MAYTTYELPTETEQNMTGLFDYFSWVQDVSGGFFFPLVLFALFIIMFIAIKGTYTSSRAFVTSSFICTVLAIMMGILGFVAQWIIYAFVILTAIGAIWAYVDNQG